MKGFEVDFIYEFAWSIMELRRIHSVESFINVVYGQELNSMVTAFSK